MHDLTKTDIRFLNAMLPDSGESRVADIAKRMKATVSLASHYKRRLIDQGVLCETGRGRVEFSMPMLKSLLAEKKKSKT